MNKKLFLKRVALYLVDLNDIERNKFISYYKEIIEDYLENGLTEQEAIEKIGSPKEIAEMILEETRSAMIPVQNRKGSLNRFFVLITFPIWGMILLSLCIMISCVPISLFIIEIVLFVVGVVSIIGAPLIMMDFHIPVGIVQFGVSIICFGVLIALFPVLALCYKKTKIWIVRVNKKMIESLRGENGWRWK